MEERALHERISDLQAENAALRHENAALSSIIDTLKKGEDHYPQIFEGALTGDFVTTVDGRIIACNPAFTRIFGFASVEDALNSRILECYDDPGERDTLLMRLQRAEKIENEGRIRRRRDGTRIHVVENMVGRFNADGELLEIRGYVYDDTDRRRMEEALRESEERFRMVLENSLDVAYRRNLQTDHYDYMSPAIGEILGFTPEEMAAMDQDEVMDRIHPEDRPAVEGVLCTSALRERALLIYRFRAKNDRYRWLEDHFTATSDPDGRPLYRGGIVRDITNRKRTERELARVHRDLESAHREANLYLDILTHDIGNTENVSNLYAELLVDSVDGAAVDYVVNLKRSITKSIEILGTVTKIRQIHAGSPTLQPTDLDAVIQAEIIHFPQILILYAGTRVTVLADDLLSEVFTNLIGNAVKHGGPDVTVTVRVEVAEGGFIRVTVTDTGQGIPDDRKEEVFRCYERKQRRVGQGLGLYLVQILIERYGGRIWVEDRIPGNPGEGAAFVFLLREGDGAPVWPGAERVER